MLQTVFLNAFIFLLLSCAKETDKRALPVSPDAPYSDTVISIEETELFILQHFLKPKDLVVEVGANVGTWTKHLLSIQPYVQVIAAEPIPQVCAR